MKNILKYSVMAAASAALLLLSGCANEELDTDQYSDKRVTLAAVAPNPVMRGGVLHLYGSNLDRVGEVRFAGGVSVNSIKTVSSGRRSEIEVTVPLDGPEVGPVVVVANDGTTLSTRFDLEYTEAIVIDSFSPAEALSGDVITITGEYLNTVREIIFGGEVYVTEFVSQSRRELQVRLPSEAVSGFVIAGDVNELEDKTTIPNQIYSADSLFVLDPTVNAFEKAVYKAGDRIAVGGAHLDMIRTVDLTGASDVEFVVSEDGCELSFNLPASAGDGQLVLTSYAGKAFEAGEIETVSVSDASIASLAQDGRFKAGYDVQITGSDLDLVTSVGFTGADAVWYYSDGSIFATVPGAAKDGAVTLTLGSGKQVYTDAIEVVKPLVSGVDATEGVAGASVIAVSGTDLDLVSAVTIGNKEQGLIDCAFETVSESALNVTLPREAYTGPLTLTAESGYAAATDAITVSYNEIVSLSFTDPSYALGRPVNVTGSGLLRIESVYVKGNKVTSYSLRSDDAMSFLLPDGMGPGVYRLTLVMTDGTELNWPVPFAVTAPYTETFIWEGYEDLGVWSNAPYLGADGAFIEAGIVVGDQVRVYYTPLAEAWQMQIFGGHWEGMTFPELDGGNTVSHENTEPGAAFFSFEVTDENIGILASMQYWGGALLTQGENVAVTGVSLIHFGATETVIWEGALETGDYANNLELGGEDDWVNAELWDGAEIRIYFTAEDPTDWSLQVFDGHWGSLSYVTPDGTQFNQDNAPEMLERGYVSFKAEGSVFEALTTKQWWGSALIVQGKNLTVTKLAFM